MRCQHLNFFKKPFRNCGRSPHMGLKESKAAKPKVEIEQPKSSPSIPVSSTVRIAVLGEPGSGKSSFVRRYVKVRINST